MPPALHLKRKEQRMKTYQITGHENIDKAIVEEMKVKAIRLLAAKAFQCAEEIMMGVEEDRVPARECIVDALSHFARVAEITVSEIFPES